MPPSLGIGEIARLLGSETVEIVDLDASVAKAIGLLPIRKVPGGRPRRGKVS
ncbi:MAG TPA: hypothetical protein VE465_19130 [Streptosporangiaceae bacterium]|jgi:hypothetical protein|nr:hypothetical protein [Streptosporangiaceae bacterium]